MPKRTHIVNLPLSASNAGSSNSDILLQAVTRAEAQLIELARELGRRAARQHFLEARQTGDQTVEKTHALG